MLWIFILEVPTGVVADTLGRKYSLALGGLITALACLVYGSVPLFVVFLAGEFLFALGAALLSGADEAWLYDLLKEHQQESLAKKIFGQMESLHLFGLFFGSIIGGYIGQYISLNAPIYLTAIPFFLSAVVSLALHEPRLHTGPKESQRALTAAIRGIGYVARHQSLRRLALNSAIVATTSYFVLWLYQPALLRLGIATSALGWIHAGLIGFEMLVAAQFTRLERWFGRWSYPSVTAALTAVGFALMAVFPSYLAVLVFLLLAGGFGLTRRTYMSTLMQEHIDSAQRATVLSAISMGSRLALVVANPIVGVLADRSPNLAFASLAGVTLLALAFPAKRS